MTFSTFSMWTNQSQHTFQSKELEALPKPHSFSSDWLQLVAAIILVARVHWDQKARWWIFCHDPLQHWAVGDSLNWQNPYININEIWGITNETTNSQHSNFWSQGQCRQDSDSNQTDESKQCNIAISWNSYMWPFHPPSSLVTTRLSSTALTHDNTNGIWCYPTTTYVKP